MGRDFWMPMALGVALGAWGVVILHPDAWAGQAIQWVAAFSGTIVAIAAVGAIWDNNMRERRAAARLGYNVYVAGFHEANAIASRAAHFVETLAPHVPAEDPAFIFDETINVALAAAFPSRQSLIPSLAGTLGTAGNNAANYLLLADREGVERVETRAREFSAVVGGMQAGLARGLFDHCARCVVLATFAQIALAKELGLSPLSASTSVSLSMVAASRGVDPQLPADQILVAIMDDEHARTEWAELVRQGEVWFL